MNICRFRCNKDIIRGQINGKGSKGYSLSKFRIVCLCWDRDRNNLCIILSLYISYQDWNGFKILKEFQNLGVFKFVFQYIYYLFETMLFMLILVYSQKSFEIWFRKENVPYGGMILAITWGLAHIFTKGSAKVGLLSGLLAFGFGVVYLLVNRDIKKTFLILFIMFVS